MKGAGGGRGGGRRKAGRKEQGRCRGRHSFRMSRLLRCVLENLY